MPSDYSRITMWALDFCRAFRARPRWARFFCRLIMGRYARNEMWGLAKCLHEEGFDPAADYDLHDLAYHKKGTPL